MRGGRVVWPSAFGCDQGGAGQSTPGFIKEYNKAQLFFSVHSALDVFVSLRFTDWRADYVSAGMALRWGAQTGMQHLSQVGLEAATLIALLRLIFRDAHEPQTAIRHLILEGEACVVPSRPGSWIPCSCWGP